MTVEIRIVDKYEEQVYQGLLERNLHSTGVFIPVWEYVRTCDPEFNISGRKIRLGAFDGDNLIGLSWGSSAEKNRFMMNISLVDEPFRRQGIYSRLLTKMLELTKDSFDEVDSYHHQFNSQIIATKLRMGFHLVGFDTCVMIGPRVQMRYFHNEKLLELMQYRVGLRQSF